MSDKNEVRIISEGGQYHVFLGTADVWLSRRQLERLHDEVRKQLPSRQKNAHHGTITGNGGQLHKK